MRPRGPEPVASLKTAHSSPAPRFRSRPPSRRRADGAPCANCVRCTPRRGGALPALLAYGAPRYASSVGWPAAPRFPRAGALGVRAGRLTQLAQRRQGAGARLRQEAPAAGTHHVRPAGRRRRRGRPRRPLPAPFPESPPPPFRPEPAVWAAGRGRCVPAGGAVPMSHCWAQIVPSAPAPLPMHCGESVHGNSSQIITILLEPGTNIL